MTPFCGTENPLLEPLARRFPGTFPVRFQLQFFARADEEGRTEDPTPRKLEKAKDEGNVPRTRDLPPVLSVLVVVLALHSSGTR